MNFDKIALTKNEFSLLQDVRDHRATYVDSGMERLIHLGFVEPDFLIQTTNCTENLNSEISITELGLMYLAYIENSQTAKKQDRRHDWRIAIFSTLGGAILSKPLWDILDSLIDALSEFLS